MAMMSVRLRLRLIPLALLAMLASSGCRTGGLGNLAGPAPQVAPRTTPEARRLLADHNRNAGRIETIDARPAMSVSVGGRWGAVDGKLAMERPRNFKLDVEHASGKVADIGSNDGEFWFWTKDSKDKAVYFCNYDEDGGCPLAGGLQPDWITEALGVRVIPDEEMDEITVTRPKEPDTLVLTHRPTRTAAGEAVTRVTILSESTRRVKEYRLLTGDQKTILAKAVIKGYQTIAPEDGSEPVYFPQRLRLDWFREKLAMEATFPVDKTKVNKAFTETRRAALFVEPTGFDRKDLARLSGVNPGQPTTVRESLPAPPAGGVRLGEPESSSAGADDEARKDRSPIALSADLPAMPSLSNEVVGAPIPRAPDPAFQTAGANNWRRSSGPSYER